MIINVGSYPPPYGGVSVHIQRLKQYLDSKKISNSIVDQSAQKKNEPGVESFDRSWKYFLFLLFRKNSLVHFHNFSPSRKYLFLVWVLSSRHTIVLSFHNERFLDNLTKNRLLDSLALRLCVGSVRSFIVDNFKCKTLAEQFVPSEKIAVIPEYISPVSVPDIAHGEITTLRQQHRYLLSSNAWKLLFHKGEDMYGVDLLVGMVHDLVVNKSMDVAMVFLLPTIGDAGYFASLKEQIGRFGLEGRFVFITDPIDEASSLWKISDLVLRATNTDGNSLTVMEALSVGTPVLASDCTERPDGVVTFASRNQNDLIEKTYSMLRDCSAMRQRLAMAPDLNNAPKFLSLYEQLMAGE